MATQTESAEQQGELYPEDDLSFDHPKEGIEDHFVDDQLPSKKPKSHNMGEQSEFDRKGEKGHKALENMELGISKSNIEFGVLKRCQRSSLGKEVIVLDSEDDTCDVYLPDDFYGEETTMHSDDDDDDEGDDDDGFYGMDNDDDDSSGLRRQQNCTILSEDDIRTRQEEDIAKISTVLSISKVSASILLRHYNWSVSNVNDAWFADEEKVRTAVGLLEKPVSPSSNTKELTCGICFDNYLLPKMSAAVCGHFFCISCWQGYISTSIKDGPGCLMLRCPDPPCGVAVDQNMIYQIVSDEDKAKYDRYLLRSYIEDNRTIKWCPAPDCNFAVEYSVGSESYDVSCKCTFSFCWNCLEEAHRPVDCDTVSKWKLKNSAESENVNWILAYSKPCPKCKRPIEKNLGCMHMTCTPPCRYQFCWLCLGDWSAHFKQTGRPNACNGYKAKEDGPQDEAEKRREMARKSLQRYTHYYERWAANQKSRQKAFEDLQKMQSVYIDRLSDSQCQLRSQLKFLTEAWLQIIECRRVLKWTYSYGYYLPEDEYAKRQLFEYLQGQAESGLERLHQCAEQDLQVYLNAEGPSNGFNEFRSKLAGLTSVTRNYFQNLVDALENGLADVDSNGACSKMGNPKSFEGDNKRKRGRTKNGAFAAAGRGYDPATFGAAGRGYDPATFAAAGRGYDPATFAAAGRGYDPATFAAAGRGYDPATFAAAGRGYDPATFSAAGRGYDPATFFFAGRGQDPAGLQACRGTTSEAVDFVRQQIPVRPRSGSGTTSSGAGHGQEDSTGPWSCVHCTYVNDMSATICQICNQQSGSWSCQECTYVNIRSDPICAMCQHQR